ncbi:MAG: DUF4276 family protein [Nitrospinae bacterium]|nr:DUF4276 family protein [Nitrospinota bacterium]
MSSIRIYVEGGGDRKDTKAKCRRGFAVFFKKIFPERKQPKITACGGRTKAFRSFCIATRQNPENINILLVDSEEPVSKRPWEHLKDKDNWDRPDEATDDSAHLMVQCMESWFLADKDVLAEYYGQGFSLNALPQRMNIEEIPKSDIQQALEQATKNSQKGTYHKTKHAFDILASIDPSKLGDDQVSVHAKRLIDYLKGLTANNV